MSYNYYKFIMKVIIIITGLTILASTVQGDPVPQLDGLPGIDDITRFLGGLSGSGASGGGQQDGQGDRLTGMIKTYNYIENPITTENLFHWFQSFLTGFLSS